MLNLALAPVWCGLHINDGGISAERPPTNLHYTRQAREAEQHPHLHKSSCLTVKVRHRWLRVDKDEDVPGQVNVKSWTTNPKKKKKKKAVIRHFPTEPIDSKCFAVSTNCIYFWLQLSGYRKRFEGASLYLLCCGLEQSCAYLVSPGAAKKKKKSSRQNHEGYH